MDIQPWLKAYPKNIRWDAEMPEYPLWEILDRAATRFPKRTCTDFFDRVTTYEEMGRLVNRATCGLQRLGVKKGTRVGLLLPNTPYFIIFYYAILKAGGVVVNLNPLYAERELSHLLADSGMEFAVTLDLKIVYDKIGKLLPQTNLKKLIVCRLSEALPFARGLGFFLLKWGEMASIPRNDKHIFYNRLMANEGALTPVAINAREDLAVLQYTGGTTGTPKGAMLTHANLVINAAQSRMWFSAAREGEEVLMCVLPFFHVFAMTVAMNLGILAGASLIVVPRFELKNVVKLIHLKKPTLFPAVPTIYAAIANFRGLTGYDLSSIKYCISGGAGLPVDVKKSFEAVTGCVVAEGYGLTETSPVATCNPLEGINKAGSIGLPLPRTVIEIISLDDRKTPMKQGERGEVCIRGPQVMRGYWNNRAETEDCLTIVDGTSEARLHTGDVGTMDKDGYTYIVDRIKDMILCGGYNVYPRNVEEAVYMHAAVAECIVAGLPDPYRGQTVKAYVTLKPGMSLTRDELLEFLKDKLSPIEMPKLVEFRDSLPKTMIGKLSRKALIEEEMAKKGQ